MTSMPVLFGHRGACALAPENTLPSFEMALQHGANAIELDAKLTRDGTVVVIHDQTVDRTTNGTGKVNELTIQQIKVLDAGSKFNLRFKDVKVPTLEEVFRSLGGKLLINVELTNYVSPFDDLVEKVAGLVGVAGLVDSVMFSSFLPRSLARMRQLIPHAKVGILALRGALGLFSRSFYGRWYSPEYVHPYYSDVNEGYILKEHKRGRKVNVWTVNDLNAARMLRDWGVDGIMTDDPGSMRRHLEGL
jgi:glycerophosphoryl diester phosphodiesterase